MFAKQQCSKNLEFFENFWITAELAEMRFEILIKLVGEK